MGPTVPFSLSLSLLDDDIQPTQVIQEQDELIKILTQENERLQELLETQVISQHKEFDMGKERFDRVPNFFLPPFLPS